MFTAACSAVAVEEATGRPSPGGADDTSTGEPGGSNDPDPGGLDIGVTVPSCTDPTMDLFVNGFTYMVDLAVDGENVYWTADEGVYAAAKAGGGPMQLSSMPAGYMDVTGPLVAFTESKSAYMHRVFSVPKTGGVTPALLWEGEESIDFNVMDVMLSGGEVYWAIEGQGAVMKKNTETMEVTQLADSDGIAHFLSVDDKHVYWNGSGLMRVSRSGGSPPELLSNWVSIGEFTFFDSMSIAGDAEWMYYTTGSFYVIDEPGAYGGVVRVSKADGHAEVLAVSSTGYVPWAIAVDDEFVYWSGWPWSDDPYVSGNVGFIEKIRKLDGARTLLGCVPCPGAIAVDQSNIYVMAREGVCWNDMPGTSSIYTLPKNNGLPPPT